MPTTMVEVLITVSQDTQAELSDGEVKFSGAYVLRALDAEGKALHEARCLISGSAVTTSDCARLLILAAAWNGCTASYAAAKHGMR